MKYQLNDSFTVKAQMGLDMVAGAAVRVVAVTTWDGLPSIFDAESMLTGDAEYDEQLQGGLWYGFRYIEDALHEDWDVMYLPADLMETIDGTEVPA